MGLDMYLYTNSRKVCHEVNDSESFQDEFNRPRGIAIYWRKANQIHRWFVTNVQCGNGDCGTYEVSVDELVELHDTCRAVLDDRSKAEKLLPTMDGFFFGSTQYDEMYWQDVQYTLDKLEKVLDSVTCDSENPWRVIHRDEPDWYVTFQYDASW